jgi:hypothetical protein
MNTPRHRKLTRRIWNLLELEMETSGSSTEECVMAVIDVCARLERKYREESLIGGHPSHNDRMRLASSN